MFWVKITLIFIFAVWIAGADIEKFKFFVTFFLLFVGIGLTETANAIERIERHQNEHK